MDSLPAHDDYMLIDKEWNDLTENGRSLYFNKIVEICIQIMNADLIKIHSSSALSVIHSLLYTHIVIVVITPNTDDPSYMYSISSVRSSVSAVNFLFWVS